MTGRVGGPVCWIATDQGSDQHQRQRADGLFAITRDGGDPIGA